MRFGFVLVLLLAGCGTRNDSGNYGSTSFEEQLIYIEPSPTPTPEPTPSPSPGVI